MPISSWIDDNLIYNVAHSPVIPRVCHRFRRYAKDQKDHPDPTPEVQKNLLLTNPVK